MKSEFTKKRLIKFLSYYKPYSNIFIMDMFFAVLSSVTVLIFPLISGYMTNMVIKEWNDDTLKTILILSFILILLIIIRVISNIIYAYFGHAMGAKMEGAMREELFKHYEYLSFDFHAKNSTGKLMTVLSNDLTAMTELFHHAPEDLIMTIIKFFGAFIIMININIPITLIVFSTIPILGLAAFYTDRRMEKYLLKNKNDLSDMNEYAEDIISGIRTVKAFGKELEHSNNFRLKNNIYTSSKCFFYKVEAFFYETVESYPQFLSMLIVIFSSIFIYKKKS